MQFLAAILKSLSFALLKKRVMKKPTPPGETTEGSEENNCEINFIIPHLKKLWHFAGGFYIVDKKSDWSVVDYLQSCQRNFLWRRKEKGYTQGYIQLK